MYGVGRNVNCSNIVVGAAKACGDRWTWSLDLPDRGMPMGRSKDSGVQRFHDYISIEQLWNHQVIDIAMRDEWKVEE